MNVIRSGRAWLAALSLALVVAIVGAARADTEQFTKSGCDIFNTAAAANTDLVSGGFVALTSDNASPVIWEATISLVTTSSVVEWTETRDGVTIEDTLNGGTALTAGCKYSFQFLGSRRSTYNWNCRTATTIGEGLIVERQAR